MIALAVLFFQVVACTGFGATVLRIFQVSDSLSWAERLAWSFIIGLGVVGWLVFFVGTIGSLTSSSLVLLLAAGCLGVFFLGLPKNLEHTGLSALERLLLACLAVTLGLDCFEGVAPPGDADSLAYHFNLPKEFLHDLHISFVPRAIDGAVPMLVQMTYIPVLGLGGEKALTLWTMVSSWGVAFTLYCFCRNHMARSWAIAATILWLTTPAVLYGGGSGQVEVRIAGFVLIAVGALIRARETGLYRWVAIAGIATGLYVGTKYTGLLFGAACGLVLFGLRRWPKQMLVFGVTSVLVGFQWYYWNWAHTGDPVFPMLFKTIGPENYQYWNEAQQSDLENFYFDAENAVPNNPFWMILYPFMSTFASHAKFDSERIGLGPFMILIVPMVISALWEFRHKISNSPLWTPALIAGVFYVIWFLTGSSQRVRHLVPLYPVFLALACIMLSRWAGDTKRLRLVSFAVTLTLAIQLSGQGASSLNYLRYSFTNETRDGFLTRNISGYSSVKWMNSHLNKTDRVLVSNRQLLYLIDNPTFFGQSITQVLIDLSPRAVDFQTYFDQLKSQKIRYILGTPTASKTTAVDEVPVGLNLWKRLVEQECADVIKEIPFLHVASRSLSAPQKTEIRHFVVRLTKEQCPATN